VIPETLAKTNLGSLPPDSKVNLERSMTLATRIGGHMVQGHIDAVCQILAIDTDEKGLIITFSLPNELKMLVVNKGYVTLDGMSLTVINRKDDQFSVAFIPHTLQATIVQFYQLGQAINIEVDVMGKYIHQYLVNYLGEYYAKH
ncbi:MAG: riboflavin synthase, partial [Gammaproteobacteria bacterium]